MREASKPTSEPLVVDISDSEAIAASIEKAEQRLLDARNKKLAAERSVLHWERTVERLKECAKVGRWGR